MPLANQEKTLTGVQEQLRIYVHNEALRGRSFLADTLWGWDGSGGGGGGGPKNQAKRYCG